MDFRTLLLHEFVFLDGGMGTMLHLAPGELPERLNLTEPARVAAVPAWMPQKASPPP